MTRDYVYDQGFAQERARLSAMESSAVVDAGLLSACPRPVPGQHARLHADDDGRNRPTTLIDDEIRCGGDTTP